MFLCRYSCRTDRPLMLSPSSLPRLSPQPPDYGFKPPRAVIPIPITADMGCLSCRVTRSFPHPWPRGSRTLPQASRRAGYHNSEWGQPLSYSFKVKQPWWWNFWMKLLYLAIIAALIWYIWRSYQQRLKFRRQLSERLAAMYALSPKTNDKPAPQITTEHVTDNDQKEVSEHINTTDEDEDKDVQALVEAEEKKSVEPKEEKVQDDVEKDEEETEMKMLDREFINRIDEVILDNINEQNLDIQFLTERMFTSHSTLYRRIKNLTGMSINEYVRKHKLTHAMQLLHEGHSIQDVSDQCGFNSVNYFRRCFKNEYGMLPSEV